MSSTVGGSRRVSVVTIDDMHSQYADCPTCAKEFDDVIHSPRVLPCLHAICVSCLESTASRGAIKCSTCELRHNIPNGDIESFRADETRLFLVNHLKVQKRNPDIQCQECNSRTKMAKSRCRECAQFLCVECVEAHKRTKLTKRHNVIPFEELRDAPLDGFQQTHTCQVPGHEEQPLAFYCFSESCDYPLCALCAVSGHQESKGHDIRDIDEVYSEVKRSVEGLLSEVKHRTLSAKDTAAAIEATVEKLDANTKQAKQQIDATFDACIKTLERRRNELKDKAESRARDKKKRLDEQHESISYHINCLEDASEFSENLATHGSKSEFLFFKDTVIDRLVHLRDEEFDTIPHDNDDLKFKPASLGEDFNKHAKELGELQSTTAYGPNTHVETMDAVLNKEQTVLNITLFDSDGLQQSTGGADMRVDVINPEGHRGHATVVDNVKTSGKYSARYLASCKGTHRATVHLHGIPLPNDYVFRAHSPNVVEGLDLLQIKEKGQDQQVSQRLHTASPSEMSVSPMADHIFGDIICHGFKMDAETAHPSFEVVEDGKTLKAKANKGGTTRRSGRDSGRLMVYRGAMANRPIQKTGLYYFEVGIVYKIQRRVQQEQVFEIALAKLDCIDKYATVDCHPYAWSVSARGCLFCGKICLQTWHNGQPLSHTPISAKTRSPPGTFIRVYYGFLLDAERRHWLIIDMKSKRVVFRFKNLVVSEMSEPLWPVFSVSNSETVSVVLTLKTGRAIDSIPPEALNALAQ